jgi:hypothetical protein
MAAAPVSKLTLLVVVASPIALLGALYGLALARIAKLSDEAAERQYAEHVEHLEQGRS